MRMRCKKWARPELEQCPYYVTEPEKLRGQWRAQFEREQPLYLELGCGKGVATTQMVHENPQVNYLALDVSTNVLGVARRNMEKTFAGEPVTNCLLFAQEVMEIERVFAPEDRVERIYINFCNPWAQHAKHHKRRLTHPRQLLKYRDFLVDGGEIWFKTDNDLLFLSSRRYFRDCGFTERYVTYDLHADGFTPNYVSEHELLYSGQGVPIKFLIAVKGPLAQPPQEEEV